MITYILIILFVIGIIYGIYTTGEVFMCVIPPMFLSVVIGLILTIASHILSKESAREDYKQNIYSLSNQTGIKGSFVLGSGNINTIEKYYTFTRNSKGGYERFVIDTNSVILYQDVKEDENPYFFAQEITYTPPEWLVPKGWFIRKNMTTYDFHVPVNTIIEKFEVR